MACVWQWTVLLLSLTLQFGKSHQYLFQGLHTDDSYSLELNNFIRNVATFRQPLNRIWNEMSSDYQTDLKRNSIQKRKYLNEYYDYPKYDKVREKRDYKVKVAAKSTIARIDANGRAETRETERKRKVAALKSKASSTNFLEKRTADEKELKRNIKGKLSEKKNDEESSEFEDAEEDDVSYLSYDKNERAADSYEADYQQPEAKRKIVDNMYDMYGNVEQARVQRARSTTTTEPQEEATAIPIKDPTRKNMKEPRGLPGTLINGSLASYIVEDVYGHVKNCSTLNSAVGSYLERRNNAVKQEQDAYKSKMVETSETVDNVLHDLTKKVKKQFEFKHCVRLPEELRHFLAWLVYSNATEGINDEDPFNAKYGFKRPRSEQEMEEEEGVRFQSPYIFRQAAVDGSRRVPNVRRSARIVRDLLQRFHRLKKRDQAVVRHVQRMLRHMLKYLRDKYQLDRTNYAFRSSRDKRHVEVNKAEPARAGFEKQLVITLEGGKKS